MLCLPYAGFFGSFFIVVFFLVLVFVVVVFVVVVISIFDIVVIIISIIVMIINIMMIIIITGLKFNFLSFRIQKIVQTEHNSQIPHPLPAGPMEPKQIDKNLSMNLSSKHPVNLPSKKKVMQNPKGHLMSPNLRVRLPKFTF